MSLPKEPDCVVGSWYQVQSASATTAGKWVNVGDRMAGIGAEMSAFVEVSHESKFFQVRLFE